jgi:phosphoglycerate dehydrogenase-like enzyme
VPRVVVATPVETELVERMRAVDARLDVAFEPELLPPPRYPSDHVGDRSFTRTPDEEERFAALVGGAEILYGIPGDTAAGLAWAVRQAPGLRFVQATSAGAGQQVRGAELTTDELARVTVASASGVHGGTLAEWSFLGILAFAKELPRLQRDQRARRWPEHYALDELHGMTLLVLGTGAIGTEVARLGAAFGMRVVLVARSPRAGVHGPEALSELVGDADAIVVTLPLTDETRGLVSRETFAQMRDGAIFVNVGRGGVVDEEALVDALRSGKLRGAALDVFAQEPLPAGSPLWGLENVLVSPHTAALSVRENERIVELFCDNLRRYLDGAPLRSRVRTDVFY